MGDPANRRTSTDEAVFPELAPRQARGVFNSTVVDVGHRNATLPRMTSSQLAGSLWQLHSPVRLPHKRCAPLYWLWQRSIAARCLVYASLVQTALILSLQAVILYVGEAANLPSPAIRRSFAVWFFGALLYSNHNAMSAIKGSTSVPKLSSFLLLNVLLIMYGAIQIYQFLDLDFDRQPVSDAGRKRERQWKILTALATATLVSLMLFTLVFLTLFYRIFTEFGRKLYTRIGGDKAVQSVFLVFEHYIVVVRLAAVMNSLWLFCNLVFILEVGSLSWSLTLLLAIVFAFLAIVALLWTFKYNYFLLNILIVFSLGLAGYYLYETILFQTRTCNNCNPNDSVLFFTYSALMGMVLSFLLLGVSVKCAHVVRSGLYEAVKGARIFADQSGPSRRFGAVAKMLSMKQRTPSTRSKGTLVKEYPFLKSEVRINTVKGHGTNRAASPPPNGSRTLDERLARTHATVEMSNPTDQQRRASVDSVTMMRLYSVGMDAASENGDVLTSLPASPPMSRKPSRPRIVREQLPVSSPALLDLAIPSSTSRTSFTARTIEQVMVRPPDLPAPSAATTPNEKTASSAMSSPSPPGSPSQNYHGFSGLRPGPVHSLPLEHLNVPAETPLRVARVVEEEEVEETCDEVHPESVDGAYTGGGASFDEGEYLELDMHERVSPPHAYQVQEGGGPRDNRRTSSASVTSRVSVDGMVYDCSKV